MLERHAAESTRASALAKHLPFGRSQTFKNEGLRQPASASLP